MSKKKGKGVSITEEPDPEAVSPTNDSPIPASSPVLTGPHPPDKANPREAPSYPTALPSTKHMPAANRSVSAQPSSSKATSVPPTASKSVNLPNKTPRKPSLSGASQPAATNQQSLNNPTQALREDILNLRAAMRTETPDNETQASTSSQIEGKKDRNAAQAECKESKYNAVFWDIEVAKDLPIWAEPITMSTERILGMFDPAADEDVLVPMGVVDGVLPG